MFIESERLLAKPMRNLNAKKEKNNEDPEKKRQTIQRNIMIKKNP